MMTATEVGKLIKQSPSSRKRQVPRRLPIPTYCLQQAIPQGTLVLCQGTTKQDQVSFKWEVWGFLSVPDLRKEKYHYYFYYHK